VRELEQLERHRMWEPRNARDAVTGLQHTADLLDFGRRLEAVDLFPKDGCDLIRRDRQVGHVTPSP
jgi:hypothetical protein